MIANKFCKFEYTPTRLPLPGHGQSERPSLMQLNVDPSWFIRYRSATNPDFGATFPQAITTTNRTAIPITNADFNNANNPNHIQVIASKNIAALNANDLKSMLRHRVLGSGKQAD
jgi:hypothetical protein